MIIEIRNQTFQLLPEKALFWPEKKILALSDVHIGKSEVFQKKGLAVPSGDSERDLYLIESLVKRYCVESLLILGDLIHAPIGMTEENLNLFQKLQKSICYNLNCKVELILGNHDKKAKEIFSTIDMQILDEKVVGNFLFCHELPGDLEVQNDLFTIYGHVHPMLEIWDRFDHLRLPCFVLAKNNLILPSFGTFTGGCTLQKEKPHRYFVIADQKILEV